MKHLRRWTIVLLSLWPCVARPGEVSEFIATGLSLAEQAQASGNQARAEAIHKNLLRTHTRDTSAPLVMEHLAVFYLDTEQPAKAASVYTRLVNGFPRHPNRMNFLRGLAESGTAAGNPAPAYERILDISGAQARSGNLIEAYQTLGLVDFRALATVPRKLAFRLCGLAAYLAERQGRLPGAILALAAQAKWTEGGGYLWSLHQEIQILLQKLATLHNVDWVL